MEDDIKWLWKLSQEEVFYSPYNTIYCISFGTRRPVVEEDFRVTLRHFFRKVPNMRTCIGERGGEKWLREMAQEKVDYEMVSNATTDEMFDRMLKHSYDMAAGPLWCVKVKPAGVGSDEEFPHLYDLFLGVSHFITDGTSNKRLSGFVIHLLDDLLGGQPVDDAEQLGDFKPDVRLKELIEEQVTLLEADPQLESSIREEYLAIQSKKSLFKSTFRGSSEPWTVVVTRVLDSDSTASFIKRCRAEGVTVHSGFTAAANLALADLLAEGGLVQDSYSIRHEHVVDSRRLIEGDTSRLLGLHLLPAVAVMTETPRNAKGGFWSYVEVLHRELVRKIKTDMLLKVPAATRSVQHAFSFEFEFSISNIGDVTKELTEGLREMRVNSLQRGVLLSTVDQTLCHYVHTLSGRLYDSIAVNTAYSSREIIEKFLDKIFDYLRASVQK